MGDSIFIFLLALMLLGPKKLPQLARQIGKLMAEFRKASNDFRMQMEDELRIEEQKEHQAKVDALAPPAAATPDPTIPTDDPVHPHMPATVAASDEGATSEISSAAPIAEAGELKMMAPSSGLPAESSARGRTYAAETENSIGGGLAGAGLSSEEPMAETRAEPAPDRGHPETVGEGERAVHV